MDNSIFITVNEKITVLPTDRKIKQHTRWIANQATVPIVNTIFGAYLNEHNHVRDAYSQQYLKSITN